MRRAALSSDELDARKAHRGLEEGQVDVQGSLEACAKRSEEGNGTGKERMGRLAKHQPGRTMGADGTKTSAKMRRNDGRTSIKRVNLLQWFLVLWMGVAKACNGKEGECYHEPCSVLGTSSKVLGECIQTKQNGKEVPATLQEMASAVERVEGPLRSEKTILQILNTLHRFVNGGGFPNPVVYICEEDVFIEVVSCIDPPGPWEQMCADFTESENRIRKGDQGGVAMIVAEPYLGNRAFTRFVFDADQLVQTQKQGSWHDSSVPFSCMERPWYNEKRCFDPLGTTCEYQFASLPLLGATQYLGYGLAGDGRCGVLGTDVSPTNVNGCLV